MTRPGYAVEYEVMIRATSAADVETRSVGGLYHAGRSANVGSTRGGGAGPAGGGGGVEWIKKKHAPRAGLGPGVASR